MLKGLYTTAMSLAFLNVQHEVTANNLANCDTPGYKKETALAQSFPEMLIYRLHDPAAAGDKPPYVGALAMGVRLSDVVTDYGMGRQEQTDNPLQLALLSEGYFVVNTPQGERYTRNGQFGLRPDGIVVTSDGYPLLGQDGEIMVEGGEFTVDDLGRVFCSGQEVDRLRVVTFQEPPVKEGSSLFRGDYPEDLANPQVYQGMIEGSNTLALEEMVKMINVSRAYEANQKVMNTHDSTLEKAVNEIARL